MLTEEERLSYIMGHYAHCPVCGDDDLDGGFIEIDGDIAWQKVNCLKCDAKWIDTYSLSDVQTRTDDGEEIEPDSANARELRDALDKLLTIFDSQAALGIDWEAESYVKLARATLAKGFPSETSEGEGS